MCTKRNIKDAQHFKMNILFVSPTKNLIMQPDPLPTSEEKDSCEKFKISKEGVQKGIMGRFKKVS